MELISREEVLALYEREHSHLATNVCEFGDMLKEIPVVEDRKVGKWESLRNGNVECSECYTQQRRELVYCPYCGAKMEVDKE